MNLLQENAVLKAKIRNLEAPAEYRADELDLPDTETPSFEETKR